MKKIFINTLIILLLAMALDLFGKIFPDFVYLVFAYPAAFLSSLFLGSQPVLIDSQEILIPLKHPIHVIPSCSAYGFFCLLLAMTVTYAFRLKNKSEFLSCVITAIPITYSLTIIINGFRIICAYHVHEMTQMLLPTNFHAVIHLGVGILLFLPTLLGVSFFLERKMCRD